MCAQVTPSPSRVLANLALTGIQVGLLRLGRLIALILQEYFPREPKDLPGWTTRWTAFIFRETMAARAASHVSD